MSTSYDVQCVTCNATTDLDLNHGGHALANALAHRAALEAFGRASTAIAKGRDGWYFDSQGDSRLERLSRFLAAHEGHQLRIRDEYGRYFDDCSADVICECGHRRYCVLPQGHTGEHRR